MSGLANGRGRYASQRGRGGWSRPFVKRQEPVKHDLTINPLGELLVSLGTSDLVPSPTGIHSSGIHDCHYFASYNWLASKDPIILVPGERSHIVKHGLVGLLIRVRSTTSVDSSKDGLKTSRGQWQLLSRHQRCALSSLSHRACCPSDYGNNWRLTYRHRRVCLWKYFRQSASLCAWHR